ncbi:hypothetical protein CsSME_00035637 [Camellia sinensis var. sinensis]
MHDVAIHPPIWKGRWNWTADHGLNCPRAQVFIKSLYEYSACTSVSIHSCVTCDGIGHILQIECIVSKMLIILCEEPDQTRWSRTISHGLIKV